MASLFEIRDKAQRAEGRQPDGIQLQVKHIPEATQKLHESYPERATTEAATSSEGQAETRRVLPPFTGIESGRNYRAMYRAVCEYHERNNPPRLTPEYWEKAAEDISATASRFNNDPFIFAMLGAVYDELEREYRTLEAKQNESMPAI